MKSLSNIFLLIVFALSQVVMAQSRNGFDISNASIPSDLILHGGSPKDGIPAIDEPKFQSAVEVADWLTYDDLVLGVEYDNIANAYPINILNWHEIVNDQFNDTAILVSFCPLCGTGIVFELDQEKAGEYGVSGLLYNSDVLLYDRQTNSLWSQILGEAVTGERLGEHLTAIPSLHTTWEHWYELHPDTLVLSRDTGSTRDYERNPYEGYTQSTSMFFPVANKSDLDLHPKERVLGIKIGDTTKAYPYSMLLENNQSKFKDVVNQVEIIIHWNNDAPVAWATDNQGNTLTTTDGFWFAWYAFYPDTQVFELKFASYMLK